MKITLPMAFLLLFVGLKLANVIDWSWWWVMSPLWIPVPLVIVAGVLIAISRALETPQERAVRLLKEYADALTRHSR